MSEIRKHYFLPEFCIIAEERAKRPSDFKNQANEPGENKVTSCFFCGGSEEKTPLAIIRNSAIVVTAVAVTLIDSRLAFQITLGLQKWIAWEYL